MKLFETPSSGKIYVKEPSQGNFEVMNFDDTTDFISGVKCVGKVVGGELKLHKNASNEKIIIIDKS